jgi:general stress protein YciG
MLGYKGNNFPRKEPHMAQGQGNSGNPRQHSRAGKEAHRQHPDLAERAGHEGGTATSHKYGKEFYQEIGKKGAEAQPRSAKVEGGKNSHRNDSK